MKKLLIILAVCACTAICRAQSDTTSNFLWVTSCSTIGVTGTGKITDSSCTTNDGVVTHYLFNSKIVPEKGWFIDTTIYHHEKHNKYNRDLNMPCTITITVLYNRRIIGSFLAVQNDLWAWDAIIDTAYINKLINTIR